MFGRICPAIHQGHGVPALFTFLSMSALLRGREGPSSRHKFVRFSALCSCGVRIIMWHRTWINIIRNHLPRKKHQKNTGWSIKPSCFYVFAVLLAVRMWVPNRTNCSHAEGALRVFTLCTGRAEQDCLATPPLCAKFAAVRVTRQRVEASAANISHVCGCRCKGEISLPPIVQRASFLPCCTLRVLRCT